MSSTNEENNKPNKFQQIYYQAAKYHAHPNNILIHLIFVPIITMASLKVLENISYLVVPFNLSYLLLLA